MNDVVYRPVPAAVRVLAILTVLASTVLLLLGGLTTSLGAGMTDKQWPTSPTHLADNPDILQGINTGLKVEHLHRVFGFLTGGLASLLAMLAWWSEPKKSLRIFGVLAVVALIVAYGQFHREMGKAWAARESGEGLSWPKPSAIATGACAIGVLAASAAAASAGRRGWAVRLFASVALIAVMIQGLLGGFRVFLDQLMGTELAAIHGTFAQLVFCLLMAIVVLTAPRRIGDTLPAEDRDRVGRWAVAIPLAIFVQLIWGVWLRHVGSPVAQRLHLLTAFVVTGMIVWMAVRAVGTPSGRKHLGFLSYHLVGIVAVQVMLGVEAWMGKFAAAGKYFDVLPTQRPVTTGMAATRTAHVLIGTALLAAAVVFAMRVWRRPVEAEEARESPTPESRREAVYQPAAVS